MNLLFGSPPKEMIPAFLASPESVLLALSITKRSHVQTLEGSLTSAKPDFAEFVSDVGYIALSKVLHVYREGLLLAINTLYQESQQESKQVRTGPTPGDFGITLASYRAFLRFSTAFHSK